MKHYEDIEKQEKKSAEKWTKCEKGECVFTFVSDRQVGDCFVTNWKCRKCDETMQEKEYK